MVDEGEVIMCWLSLYIVISALTLFGVLVVNLYLSKRNLAFVGYDGVECAYITAFVVAVLWPAGLLAYGAIFAANYVVRIHAPNDR